MQGAHQEVYFLMKTSFHVRNKGSPNGEVYDVVQRI